MIDLSKIENIYLYTGKTDLRMSIFGLSVIIQESFPLEKIRHCLFIFCSHSKANIKIIELDYDGFWLYQKKLHKRKFRWPKKEGTDTLLIDKRQLLWLLDGLDISQRNAHEDVKIRATY